MKRLILIFIGLTVTISTFAQVDGTLSYQGYLTDENGDPETGEHNFKFNFYIGSASVADFSRGPIFNTVDKGLFTVTIGGGLEGHGGGTVENDALPLDIWNAKYEIGIVVDGAATELARVPLTAVPYSFQSESANSVEGANITGTIDATQLTGTIANGRLDADLQDLADGSLSGSLVGSGIDGANITNGTLPTAKISGTMAIANGGTGATTKADARTSLGLAIGTNVQAYDANLDDLSDGSLTGSKVGAGISGANITNGTIPTAKISGTIAVADGGTGASTAATARTSLGLAIGTNIQAYNASLQSISSLSPGANGMLYSTGTDAYALTTLTATGRSILDDNSTGDVLTTIGAQPLDADLTDLADGTLSALTVETTTGIEIGNNNSATGTTSIAFGENNSAEGNYSLALGSYARTTGSGTVYLGDRSVVAQTTGSSANRFYARFANGYLLYSNSALSAGVSLAAGGTSWGVLSDSTKKENYKKIDGEIILKEIAKLKLGTWNYVFHDKSIRHYGPYAQDFFNAFGSDDLGFIGCDTLITTQDISGLNMTAIKALVLRTNQLQVENEKLKLIIANLKTEQIEIDVLKKQISEITALLGIRERPVELNAKIDSP